MYMTFQPTRFIHSTDYPALPWALTSHFHPYLDKSWRLFSATLAVSRLLRTPLVKWCGALRCSDFPLIIRSAMEWH